MGLGRAWQRGWGPGVGQELGARLRAREGLAVRRQPFVPPVYRSATSRCPSAAGRCARPSHPPGLIGMCLQPGTAAQRDMDVPAIEVPAHLGQGAYIGGCPGAFPCARARALCPCLFAWIGPKVGPRPQGSGRRRGRDLQMWGGTAVRPQKAIRASDSSRTQSHLR